MIYRLKPTLILLLILVITFFIYSPGLSGDYLFDDVANIVENQKIAIISLDYSSLRAAFWSGDAGPLGRPISMLSFAINHYFTGFNPYYFKLTNLIIHLMNGILIYWISLSILKKIYLNDILPTKIYFLSLMVSLIWLIHPLNLTSVLYIVQRMTSLSALFGLLALLLYCKWRECCFITFKFFYMWIGIGFFLICSAYSKESGLLFVGLIYLVEICIFKGKDINNIPIFWFGVSLNKILWTVFFIGLLFFIYISLPHIYSVKPVNRDFTIVERLLSESRVIFFYLKMIFFPTLADLSLYHDDFEISKNLLNPISTIYSILGIIFISLVSLFVFRKFPLLLFSWGWFIISHLMESTFISLELIHEHRNYFSSIGFIIAIVYGISEIRNKKIGLFVLILCIVYCVNLGFTTWQRAIIWSNLVDHAAFEVAMHPKSDRANYQMARVYLKLMEKNPSEKEYFANQAEKYLLQANESYKPANGSWFAQIHLASYLNKPVRVNIITQLKFNLENHPFYNSNIGFLSAFTQCQIKQYCNIPHEQAIEIIVAGLKNPRITPEFQSEIHKLLAQYFISVIGDYQKGEEFLLDALKYKNDISGNLLLVQVYILQKKYNSARKYLRTAQDLDIKKSWTKEIAIEVRNLNQTELKGM